MSSKKRPEKFFGRSSAEPGSEATPPPPVATNLEIVGGDGRPMPPPPASGPSVAPPPPRPEPPVPYLEAPKHRSASLTWAWLTIVVTLLLAVGSYWFYEGFDGDVEKVRDRARAFSHRLVPEERITPLPREDREIARVEAPATAAPEPEPGDQQAPFAAAADQPAEAPAAGALPTAPPTPTETLGAPLVGALNTPSPTPTALPLLPPSGALPTRPRPTSPSMPPSNTDESSGWYRTPASIEPAAESPTPTPTPSPTATPAPMFVPATQRPTTQRPTLASGPPPVARSTPEPRMTPLAAPVLGAESESPAGPRPTLGAEGVSSSSGAEGVGPAPGASEGTAPSVVLPAELSSFDREPASPTPRPSPVPISQQGMAQMSVGRVTAGGSLVDLGLVYASRALGRIHRNFSPPFARSGTDCRVAFRILRDGNIEAVAVTKSSGMGALDSAAVEAVRSSAPFEALNPMVEGTGVRVEVRFDF